MKERSNGALEAQKKGRGRSHAPRVDGDDQVVGVFVGVVGSSGFAVLKPRNGCRPYSVSFSARLP